MIRGISVTALSIFIGACASSGPQDPTPAAMAGSETGDPVALDNPSSQSEDELHELAANDAPEITSVSSESESDELVCRREKEMGSNFYRKVCYTQAQLDAREEADQDAVRRMNRIGTHSEPNSGGG